MWRILQKPPPDWLVILSVTILVTVYFYNNFTTSKKMKVTDYSVLVREIDSPEKLFYGLFYLLPALQK